MHDKLEKCVERICKMKFPKTQDCIGILERKDGSFIAFAYAANYEQLSESIKVLQAWNKIDEKNLWGWKE